MKNKIDKNSFKSWPILFGLAFLLFFSCAKTSEKKEEVTETNYLLRDIKGTVSILRQDDVIKGENDLTLMDGDTVRTGPNSIAFVYLKEEKSIIKILANTKFLLNKDGEDSYDFNLIDGKSTVFINKVFNRSEVKVTAKNTVVAVRGTFFGLANEGGKSQVALYSGRVSLKEANKPSGEEFILNENTSVSIDQEKPLTVESIEVESGAKAIAPGEEEYVQKIVQIEDKIKANEPLSEEFFNENLNQIIEQDIQQKIQLEENLIEEEAVEVEEPKPVEKVVKAPVRAPFRGFYQETFQDTVGIKIPSSYLLLDNGGRAESQRIVREGRNRVLSLLSSKTQPVLLQNYFSKPLPRRTELSFMIKFVRTNNDNYEYSEELSDNQIYLGGFELKDANSDKISGLTFHKINGRVFAAKCDEEICRKIEVGAGKWHQIKVLVDFSNGTARYYVDNKLFHEKLLSSSENGYIKTRWNNKAGIGIYSLSGENNFYIDNITIK